MRREAKGSLSIAILFLAPSRLHPLPSLTFKIDFPLAMIFIRVFAAILADFLTFSHAEHCVCDGDCKRDCQFGFLHCNIQCKLELYI